MTDELRERFREDGFAGPFRVVPVREIAGLRREIDRSVLTAPGLDPRSPLQSRHLDSPLVYDLCTRPAILRRVAAILGPEIVLWRSNFFLKPSGAASLAWHRDRTHWGSKLDPAINVTAWIALDAARRENGCLRVLPRSSQRCFAPSAIDARGHDLTIADEAEAVEMELSAGECLLFDADTLHASGENVSGAPRYALAARFTQPHVRVDGASLFPGHRCVTLRVSPVP